MLYPKGSKKWRPTLREIYDLEYKIEDLEKERDEYKRQIEELEKERDELKRQIKGNPTAAKNKST